MDADLAGDYLLDFGTVRTWRPARRRHITLHALGPEPIAIATCMVDGASAFEVATPCPFTIAAGSTAKLTVAFAPTTEDELTGTLHLSGSGFATGALAVELRGTGDDRPGGCSAASPGGPAAVALALLGLVGRRRRRRDPRSYALPTR